ncbi:HD domain-containing protein [candidate division KSB1 bacterium]|nr:HD domain-containing protein [candidate division KSB1 bacterium]
MKKNISIIFIEDNQDDVELTLYELKKHFNIHYKVVESREDFFSEINQKTYDIILADYKLPDWTGIEALQWLRQNNNLTPFILVTGAIGEETAAECIREGADNYILKDNLARLSTAIEQAQENFQIKQGRAKDKAALEESEELLRAVFESAIDAIFTKNIQGEFLRVNQAFKNLVKLDEKQIIDKKNKEIYPESLAKIYDRLDQTALKGETVTEEVIHEMNGHRFVLQINQVPIRKNNHIFGLCGIARDITNTQLVLNGTISAITKMVEQRDPYTSGHQLRVSELATAIAKELNLTPQKIKGLQLAASLHDIGKAFIPAELLSKPSNLTEAETRIIRQHPVLGAEILRQIPFPWTLARFVEEHHEKMDGSGYPKSLVGEQISLEARIICVADIVDSIITHRPYRPAKRLEVALVELKLQSGIKFDPMVIEALDRVVENGYFDNGYLK